MFLARRYVTGDGPRKPIHSGPSCRAASHVNPRNLAHVRLPSSIFQVIIRSVVTRGVCCVLAPAHALDVPSISSFDMAQIVLDNVAWVYLSLFIIWNVAFIAGLTFLWTHRQLPSLRMRRIPLLLTGLFFLHAYGGISFVQDPFGAYFPCTAEFWVMSIILPFGFALFQTSNSQFLFMATRQKHFAHTSSLTHREPIDEKTAQTIVNSRWRRVLAGLRPGDNIDRTLVSIGLGMVVQVSHEPIMPRHHH